MSTHFMLLHPADGGSKVLRNISILPRQYATSQLRSPRLEISPL